MDRPHPLAWPPRHGRVVVRVGEPLAPDAPDLPLAEFLTARWGLHTARLRRTCYLRNRRSWPDAACPSVSRSTSASRDRLRAARRAGRLRSFASLQDPDGNGWLVQEVRSR